MRNCCPEYQTIIQLYVDGELSGEEREEFRVHLASCADCSAAVQEEESFSKLIRAARPTVVAPESLRQAVLERLHHAEEIRSGPKIVPRAPRFNVGAWSMAAAAVFVLCVIGGIPLLRQWGQNEAGTMMQTAILAHQQLSQKAMPLDIASDSPQELTTWFRSRVAFPFRMADSGIASDLTAKYTLMGGRLVTVKSEALALVAFNTPHGVVTLLVGPERLMKASGGAVVESGGILLHTHDRGSLHIVTWNTQGLSYVLTSSKPEGKQQSCGSCHEESSPGMKS